jgi:hypothetical protein
MLTVAISVAVGQTISVPQKLTKLVALNMLLTQRVALVDVPAVVTIRVASVI